MASSVKQNSNVISFGCRLNAFESEIMMGFLQKHNIEDAIVINSCAVTAEAERELRNRIRKEKRLNPNKKIIVTGCATQISPQKYKDMPEIDLIVGNSEKMQESTFAGLASKLGSYSAEEKVLVRDIMEVKEERMPVVKSNKGHDSAPRSRAFIQIQNGCNHRCTFCIIPYGRGNSRSVPLGDIASSIRNSISDGYNEIVLTGVDITDYGKDLVGSVGFTMAIKRILSTVPELKRLRLSSVDVAELDDSFIDLFVNEPRLVPYLHISLQSGDNLILKRMKRRHSREQVIDFCRKIRNLRPDVAFGADIIAGFPTETEKHFENTIDLISEAEIAYVHAFTFSEREGTPAARMPQVKPEVRKKRTARLIAAGQAQLEKLLNGSIGKVKECILERGYIARADNFMQINLNCSQEEKTKLKFGQICKVKIESVASNKKCCQGSLVNA